MTRILLCHMGMRLSSFRVNKFFLMLLVFASISACSFAYSMTQTRYTVNRPIPAPPSKPSAEDLSEYVPTHSEPVRWETNYEQAKQSAEQSGKMLLIYLYPASRSVETEAETRPQAISSSDQTPTYACRKFETIILDDEAVRTEMDKFVRLKLPSDAVIKDVDGKEMSIVSLSGLEHMQDYTGLAVVDYAHREEPYYGQVTGILPYWDNQCPTAKQTETFLTLPPGTLSQRTLVYAVRTHRDQPLSSGGEMVPIVVQKATEHASYQAERGVLGHQNFSQRSSEVEDVLGDVSPSEICAQSRPGIGLFEAAVGCMRAWRNSPAHWSIARRSHRFYGYDMVKSENGAWYAVGFFMD